MPQDDIPLAFRFLLFWGTAAGLAGWLMLVRDAQLLPREGVPPAHFFKEFPAGWTALILGWAGVGYLNGLARRGLEDATVDADAAPEEAALRRRDRFYRRRVQNNKHWYWSRQRVQNLTGAEVPVFERRRQAQYWLSALGIWLVTVVAHLPQLANVRWAAVWGGLALVVGFPFFKGLEGLGRSQPATSAPAPA